MSSGFNSPVTQRGRKAVRPSWLPVIERQSREHDNETCYLHVPAVSYKQHSDMKFSSKIHSLRSTAQDDDVANPTGTIRAQRAEQQDVVPSSSGGHLEAGRPLPPAARTTQDAAAAPGSAYLGSYNDEELAEEVPGLRVHAPWPGLHGACEGCGAPSVSGLGSGPTECEHCHRQIAGGEGGARGKPPAKGKGSEAARARVAGKDGVVAVTSSREIVLGDERAKALAWAGATMLVTSLLLLLLLLIAW